VVEVGLKTWIARLRTDHVAIFPVNGSKIPNAAVVVGDLAAVIASAAVADSAVIVPVAADLAASAVAVALVDSVAAVGSGADGEN